MSGVVSGIPKTQRGERVWITRAGVERHEDGHDGDEDERHGDELLGENWCSVWDTQNTWSGKKISLRLSVIQRDSVIQLPFKPCRVTLTTGFPETFTSHLLDDPEMLFTWFLLHPYK